MAKHRSLRQLIRLLETERDLLLKGDFAKLSRLPSRKQSLLEKVALLPLTAQELREIETLAARNQSLFKAAEEGLLAVRARLTEIQKGAPLETYSATGKRRELDRPKRTLQRRA